MAPSADPQAQVTPVQDIEPVEKRTENGLQNQSRALNLGDPIKAGGKPKVINSATEKGKSADVSKDGKLSGKELKDRAKAEKAARRAKGKQEQQGQPVVDLGASKPPNQRVRKPSAAAITDSSSTSKSQQTRTGSISGQKLPLRPTQDSAPPISAEPEKSNKAVALFDHLYGPPRRTTIAGASKDVHPAVLALGLQMRNYSICGSSARCVATLLAFKRVCGFLE